MHLNYPCSLISNFIVQKHDFSNTGFRVYNQNQNQKCVEHKKCSKMYFRIVRFGFKLRKWDHFQWKADFSKNANFSCSKLPQNHCISTREYPKILKIYQITKLDIGFQKKNTRGRNSNIDFIESYGFLRHCYLKR